MKTGIVGIHNHVMGKVDGLSPAYQVLLLVAVVLCALSVVTSGPSVEITLTPGKMRSDSW